MATLVLGVVGRAVLGPVGGIVGTLLGGVIDQRLAGGRSRGTARAADPQVQAASYGEPIPVVRGRMRVSGNVIWAAPLRETVARSSKRGGSSASWSASFAVLLGRGPIMGVGRVWADGKLLRDAAGQWLQPVTMRLLTGSERQPPDPLLASAEAAVPAFRGLAVAVFEDLPLGDFGNRLPTLAFEIVGDDGPVDLGAAIADLAAQAGAELPALGEFPQVGGLYLGWPAPLAEALAPAVQVAGAVLAAGAALIGPGRPALPLLPGDATGARNAGEGNSARDRRRRAATGSAADAVEIGYFDPARDFQPGLQRARLRPGARIDSLALPLVLDAAVAKQLGQQRLLQLAAARQQRTLHLPWRYLGLRPGDVLRIGTQGQEDWRVRELRFAGFVLSLDLVRVSSHPAPQLAGDSGRSLAHEERPAGPTTLLALDLPPLPGELPAAPRLWLAAAGAGPGWRPAPVQISLDGGTSWQEAGTVPAAVPMGQAVGRLPPHGSAAWDHGSRVEVELASDAMWLESRPAHSVLAGSNLALIGNELVQFASAEAIAPRRFRLSGLLRGRRGTDWAVGSHAAGERFVLIEPAAMLPLPLPLELLGQTLLLRAVGAGDLLAGVSSPVAVTVGAAGLQPLAPVHLQAWRHAGQLRARWRPQSRAGFGWPDLADVPSGEARTAFRVVLRDAAGVLSDNEVTAPAWDGPDIPGPLWLDVTQLGLVPGRTASIAIP